MIEQLSNRTKLIRIGLGTLIVLALVMYFVPMVPVQFSCASFTMGLAVPYDCLTHSTVTSYKSPSLALLGHGAYLYYFGYYDPGVVVGTTSLTLSGAITFIIVPFCALAILLVLGKARIFIITKALIRQLSHV